MPTVRERRGLRAVSIILGICVFSLGAALALFLLQTVFPSGYSAGPLSSVAGMLFLVYGFSSFFVPLFLLYAAILLLIPGWTARAGFVLAGSIVPFFTAVGCERMLRSLSRAYAGSPMAAGIYAGIIACALFAVAAEYVLLLALADRFARFPGGDAPARSPRPRAPVADAPLSVSGGQWPEHVSLDDEDEPSIPPQGAANSGGDSPVEPSSVPFEDDRATEAQVEAISGPGVFQTAPEHEASLSKSRPETPAYVDFERMKAPFDLPVVDDWVETAPEQDSVPESDRADDLDAAEEPAERDEILLDDDLVMDGEGGIELNDGEVFEEPSLRDDRPFVNMDPVIAPKPEEAPIHVVFSDSEQFVDDHPFEVSFEDLADYNDPAVFDTLDEETAAEAAEEPEFPLDEDDEDLTEDELIEDELIDDDLAEDGLIDDPEEALSDLPPIMDVPVARTPPRRARRNYEVPFDILNTYPDGEYWIIDDATRRAAAALKETLNEFRIQADVTGIRKGPVITMFEILPAPGVKLSKIVGLQDNIALRLAASSVRIVAPIPGKHAVGIEVPNLRRSLVSFRELIEADTPQAKKMEIPVILGKDITGEAQLLDLATTPHLLIAGSTGAGKSVCVNSIILSILYKRSPDEVKLILIDPKIVELKLYNDIGHLLAPVITEPKKAFQSLQYCLCEMERRYALLDGMGVRDIKSYNRRIIERHIATEKLPYLVVIIDEFADLMATTGKELESTVARLCAMSRAVGIHLVLATQRPSIDVITGLIKANIPSRIAFMVASKMDSRIIIDQVGAEKLLGRGDMLYASATDPFPTRIQGAFVSEEEVERVVEHVKTLGEPEYIDEEIFVDDEDDEEIDQSLFSEGEDPLYDKALEIVLNAGKASASYIQRKLKIGYNRAARLVEDMEARGIVGPANGSKPREVVHRP